MTSSDIAETSLTELIDLTGRTAVVTGGSAGIGRAITESLIRSGARVFVGARDADRAQAVAEELTARAGKPGAVEVHQLDLADLDSVRSFAGWVASRTDRIDLLFNNAGISNQEFHLASAGVESQFAVNHLGHFALTGLLLPLLSAAYEARVVTVSSGLYVHGQLDLSLLADKETYSPGGGYVRSKLANVLFATELEGRLRAAGSRVRSFVAHPGLARTPMHERYPSPETTAAVQAALATMGREPEHAIAGIIYAATAPEADPASFYGPDGDLTDPHVGVEPLAGPANASSLAADLWQTSIDLSGVGYLD